MAKSARASSTKNKRAALRSKVFNPAEQARLERLSSRLLDLASQPKPNHPEKMEVDEVTKSTKSKERQDNKDDEERMNVDQQPAVAHERGKSKKTLARNAKGKTRRGKPTSSVTFRVHKRGKVVDPGRRKKR